MLDEIARKRAELEHARAEALRRAREGAAGDRPPSERCPETSAHDPGEGGPRG